MNILTYIKTKVAEYRRNKQLKSAPTTLDEAIKELDRNSTEGDRTSFANTAVETACGSLHFGSGMSIRNKWGLWVKEQPLTQWFRERGIWHADDMSTAIFKAYWFQLNGMKFDILREAKKCEKYWEKQGLGFDGVELPKLKSKFPSGWKSSTSGVAGAPKPAKHRKPKKK